MGLIEYFKLNREAVRSQSQSDSESIRRAKVRANEKIAAMSEYGDVLVLSSNNNCDLSYMCTKIGRYYFHDIEEYNVEKFLSHYKNEDYVCQDLGYTIIIEDATYLSYSVGEEHYYGTSGYSGTISSSGSVDITPNTYEGTRHVIKKAPERRLYVTVAKTVSKGKSDIVKELEREFMQTHRHYYYDIQKYGVGPKYVTSPKINYYVMYVLMLFAAGAITLGFNILGASGLQAKFAGFGLERYIFDVALFDYLCNALNSTVRWTTFTCDWLNYTMICVGLLLMLGICAVMYYYRKKFDMQLFNTKKFALYLILYTLNIIAFSVIYNITFHDGLSYILAISSVFRIINECMSVILIIIAIKEACSWKKNRSGAESAYNYYQGDGYSRALQLREEIRSYTVNTDGITDT